MKSITPKFVFLQSPEGSDFAELQNNRSFRAAVETALQQMVMEQRDHTRFEDDARAHVELQGAKRYIDILLNLATADTPKKPDNSGVLKCQSKPPSSPPQPRQPRKTKPPLPPELPRI